MSPEEKNILIYFVLFFVLLIFIFNFVLDLNTNNMKTGLTLEQSIQIQDQHLLEWGNVLKPDVHEKLVRIVKNRNKGVTNPYQISRGGDINNIVQNLSMGNDCLYDESEVITIHVVVEIDTKKDFETIKQSLTRGIYRGLDSEPVHVAQPKNVNILSIYSE
jgi:hypothetical protein